MPVTWTPIAPTGPAWAALPGDRDDWIDPLTVPLLTESGLYIAENGDFLCTETVNRPPSPWVAL